MKTSHIKKWLPHLAGKQMACLAVGLSTAIYAHAQTTGAINIPILCDIAALVGIQWLFVAGIVAIVAGALSAAFGKEESFKVFAAVIIPLGIAAAAPFIMSKITKVQVCPQFSYS